MGDRGCWFMVSLGVARALIVASAPARRYSKRRRHGRDARATLPPVPVIQPEHDLPGPGEDAQGQERHDIVSGGKQAKQSVNGPAGDRDVEAAPDGASGDGATLVRQGYNVVHWDRSGMTFWAVSDLNVTELQQFAQLLQN